MDPVQIYLKKEATKIIASLDDRQRLKNILLDCLSGNKLQLNLLFNAYDSGLTTKLQNSDTVPDKNLFVQALVHSLTSDYGITEQAALWAIESWCLILGVPSFPIDRQADAAITADNTTNILVSQFGSSLSTSLKANTIKSYILEIKKFITHKNIKVISDITSDNVNDYIENGTDGYSSISSLKHRRCIFEKLLKFLASRGLVQSSLLSACGMDFSNANNPSVVNSSTQKTVVSQVSTIASSQVNTNPLPALLQRTPPLQNNPLLPSLVVPKVPQAVLNKLLEEDDYIDFSLSLIDTYYVIRSPSNENKAGISLDRLIISQDNDGNYSFLLEVSRKIAKLRKSIDCYIYSNTGIFVDKNGYNTPDFDHYKWSLTRYSFPGRKITRPFFIRLRFQVD